MPRCHKTVALGRPRRQEAKARRKPAGAQLTVLTAFRILLEGFQREARGFSDSFSDWHTALQHADMQGWGFLILGGDKFEHDCSAGVELKFAGLLRLL